jgi:LmbE family N-acetylglucosaminyl deacetylase
VYHSTHETINQQKQFNIYFPPGYTEDQADMALDVSHVWEQKQRAMKTHISQKLDREAFLSTIDETYKKELFLVKTR